MTTTCGQCLMNLHNGSLMDRVDWILWIE